MALNGKFGNVTLNAILKQRPGRRTDLIGRMNDRFIWVRSRLKLIGKWPIDMGAVPTQDKNKLIGK